MENKVIKNIPIIITIIGVCLIFLKLFGVLQLSWILILCPFWIPFTLFTLIMLLIGITGSVVIFTKLLKYLFS